jgi:signal transduction histidine kinase
LILFFFALAVEFKLKPTTLAANSAAVVVQAIFVISLYYLAPNADFWALFLLPACYNVMQQMAMRQGYGLVGFMMLVAVASLWYTEGGWSSILYSSLYSVAFVMVAAFSLLLKQVVNSRNESIKLSAQLEQANHQLRALADRAAEMAIVEERTALARELHDSATQTVFSINLLINSLEQKYDLQPKPLADDIEKIASLSDTAMKELRAIIKELKPAELTPTNFYEQLQNLLDGMYKAHALEVDLDYDKTPMPRLAIAATLKVIREALYNVIKHSGVKRASLIISGEGQQIRVTIADAGIGFKQPMIAQAGHMGLDSMNLHCLEIGGQLLIKSKPEQGTTIEITIPVSTKDQISELL